MSRTGKSGDGDVDGEDEERGNVSWLVPRQIRRPHGQDEREGANPVPGCFSWLGALRHRRRRALIAPQDNVFDAMPGRGSPRRQALIAPQDNVFDAMLGRGSPPPPPPPSPPAGHNSAAGDLRDGTALPGNVSFLIASRLPSAYDREALQAVSTYWRHAVRNCPTRPSPLIMTADFCLIGCFGSEEVTRAIHPDVSPSSRDQVTCLGSHNNMVVLAFEPEWDPTGNLLVHHCQCILVHPLKGSSICFPNPSGSMVNGISGSCNITEGNGIFVYGQPVREAQLRLQHIVLSEPGTKAVGLATARGNHHLVLCTPEMQAWCVCSAPFITLGADLEFLADKLYILGSNQQELYQIDFGPDMTWFPHACAVRLCVAMELPQDGTHVQRNLVRSGSDLLLVARTFDANWEQLMSVRVFELNAQDWTWRERQTLNGQTILVSLCSSVAVNFAGHEDRRLRERVYFLDHFCPGFFAGRDERFSYRSQVYDMQEGEISQLLIGAQPASMRPGFPIWFSPTE